MTDIEFTRAMTYLSQGGRSSLETYLGSVGSDKVQFANIAYTKGVITNKEGWKKIVGYDMPDPALEQKFSDFRERLHRHEFSYEELQAVYTEQRYNEEIQSYIIQRLDQKSLNETELKEWYKRGIVSIDLTKKYCDETSLDFDQIDRKPKPKINIPPHLWPTDANLTYGNTDVLLIGSPGAGKTMLLASLYYYANRVKGTLNPDARNNKGFAYSSLLISAIQQGQFIIGTKPDIILHTSATISGEQVKKGIFTKTRIEGIECPFNFIEMAGETYNRAFGKSISEWPDNLRSCFEGSKNPKIILLTIPVDEEYITIAEGTPSEMRLSAEQLYSYIIQLFIDTGVIDHIVAVGLIATKWDKQVDKSDEGFDKFIRERCYGIDQTLSNENIEYEKFDFSIGFVDDEVNSYQFNPEPSSHIYDWLMECAPIRPNK